MQGRVLAGSWVPHAICCVWYQVLVGCWLSRATPVLVGRESHAMSGSCWMWVSCDIRLDLTISGSCWMLDASYEVGFLFVLEY